MENGQWWARHAVVTIDKVIEAKALVVETSAQRAELIALIKALELSQRNKVNIYTDSKYALMVVHAHGAIQKERRLFHTIKKVLVKIFQETHLKRDQAHLTALLWLG